MSGFPPATPGVLGFRGEFGYNGVYLQCPFCPLEFIEPYRVYARRFRVAYRYDTPDSIRCEIEITEAGVGAELRAHIEAKHPTPIEQTNEELWR